MRSVSVNKLKPSVVILITAVCWMISMPTWGEETGGYRQTWGITGPSTTISGQKYILTASVGYPDPGLASGNIYNLIGGIEQGAVLVRTVTFYHIGEFANQWLQEIEVTSL